MHLLSLWTSMWYFCACDWAFVAFLLLPSRGLRFQARPFSNGLWPVQPWGWRPVQHTQLRDYSRPQETPHSHTAISYLIQINIHSVPLCCVSRPFCKQAEFGSLSSTFPFLFLQPTSFTFPEKRCKYICFVAAKQQFPYTEWVCLRRRTETWKKNTPTTGYKSFNPQMADCEIFSLYVSFGNYWVLCESFQNHECMVLLFIII